MLARPPLQIVAVKIHFALVWLLGGEQLLEKCRWDIFKQQERGLKCFGDISGRLSDLFHVQQFSLIDRVELQLGAISFCRRAALMPCPEHSEIVRRMSYKGVLWSLCCMTPPWHETIPKVISCWLLFVVLDQFYTSKSPEGFFMPSKSPEKNAISKELCSIFEKYVKIVFKFFMSNVLRSEGTWPFFGNRLLSARAAMHNFKACDYRQDRSKNGNHACLASDTGSFNIDLTMPPACRETPGLPRKMPTKIPPSPARKSEPRQNALEIPWKIPQTGIFAIPVVFFWCFRGILGVRPAFSVLSRLQAGAFLT